MTAPPGTRIDEPIALPEPAAPPRPARWPLLAALVPVAGGIVMWAVTGSLLSLCFAALGPLMAVAAAIDGRRHARRERRSAERAHTAACARAEREIALRHAEEREELDLRHPDVAALVLDERLVWRSGADDLVVGRGDVASRVRTKGGGGVGPGEERTDALRRAAGVLQAAPVVVAAADGVCVRGNVVLARAVARALVAQLCAAASPREVALVAAPAVESWTDALPHRCEEAQEGARRLAFLVGGREDGTTAGGPRVDRPADIVIAAVSEGEEIPAACGVLLELRGGQGATLVRGPRAQELLPEAISLAQAEEIAARLAARGPGGPVVDAPHTLASLEPIAAGAGRLPAVVGTAGGSPAALDIVVDGPHAVVVGTTGAGKSELLVTWIASLARTYTPERVVFLLADFKGGTAFDALRVLPHVTGVITDLDASSSRRAVESLRAELRRREERLTAVGARDVAEPAVGMPRLVIVVDEFAAMLQDHPDLHAVFSDVAARGRALGMHLVLGTQRSTGVVRDALVANCPLRIALRVAERAESRALIGSDAAADLSGAPEARGLALIRRAGDSTPRLTRIALTPPAEVAAIAGPRRGPRAVGPWLPPLPGRLELGALRSETEPGAVVLGRADDPDRQRQPVVTLRPGRDRGLVVLGAAGTGKTSLARLVSAQHPGAVLVPRDAEGAWDAVARAEEEPPPLFVVDDLDALLTRYPHDYGQLLAERLETIVRDAGERGSTVVLTAARATGAAGRIVDLLPRRAILSLATRADHIAAGGDGASFDPSRPPGRAILDGRETQFAMPPDERETRGAADPPAWRPSAPVTALVVRAPHRRRLALADGWGGAARIMLLEELGAGLDAITPAGGGPVVVAGDAEGWQRQWALLQDLRGRVPMVVGAECAAELRTLTGERELPPYARTRAARAWLFADGRPPRRVLLPG